MRKTIIAIIILSPLALVVALQQNLDYELEQIHNEIEESKSEHKKFLETYIKNNPNSPLSVLFLFKLSKPNEANFLMEELITQNIPEAIYAKSVITLEGKYLKASTEEALNTLEQLCEIYIEPCIHIGNYYRKNKQDQLAIYYLHKVENTNEIIALSELRIIYANKNSKMYNEEKSQYYAKRMSQAIHHKTETRYHLTKYITVKAHNKGIKSFAIAHSDRHKAAAVYAKRYVKK